MIKRNIPNAITCGNLFCGCLAIVKCFDGDLVWAAYLVGIAAVLDFLDGFVARLLHVTSPIGKDLDSLADMVTFGVVPGLIIFKMILFAIDYHEGMYSDRSWISHNLYKLSYVAFLIPIFSAIRLAKFNHDTRQSESFIGLPTPANAILICSLPLVLEFNKTSSFAPLILNYYLLVLCCCLLSFLLIAPIHLFALKFKNFKWQGNEIRYLFLIWSVLLLVFLHFIGIPFVILSYILFSLFNNILKKTRS